MARGTLPDDGMDESLAAEDAEEFEALYRAQLPAVRRFLFWRTQDNALADDLASAVFTKAWRNRRRFDGRSAAAWLHAIARNTLIDYWRSKKAVPVEDTEVLAVSAEHATADSSEALDRAMTMDAVRAAVAGLPRPMRQVVESRFVDGLSCRETAERLGLTEANVRVLQYRALRKIKEKLS